MSKLTLDEAIKHCLEVAEQNETKALSIEGTIIDRIAKDCRRCAADHRQLAEWLRELKETKRLLKAAVEQMAEVGDICDCIHSQNCPLDECGKFTFHDEMMKFIND